MRKTDICRDYRDRYPDYPSLKLARIIYNEHNLTFKDIEAVRDSLRYIEGKKGLNKKRNILNNPDNVKYLKDNRPYNPYNLPQSDEVEYMPFIFGGFKRIAIMSDIHFPYHNIEAMSVAMDGIKKIKPDAILLNGDIIDCHRLSRFVKDPKKRDFKYEVDMLKGFFNILEKQFGCRIIYKLGNHEDRYQRFLYEKASEISGIDDFQFSNLIRTRERGIIMVEANQYMQIGKMIGIHGHEFMGQGSGDMIAKSMYTKGSHNLFQGHNHRTDSYTRRNPFTGEITRTYSIGCLSELHPGYNVLQKFPWNYGWAWMDVDGQDFEFHNLYIDENTTRNKRPDTKKADKAASKRGNSNNRKPRKGTAKG